MARGLSELKIRILKGCLPNAGLITFNEPSEHRAMNDLVKRGLLSKRNVVSRNGKDVFYFITKLGSAALKKRLSK